MSAPDPYAATAEAFTIGDWQELVANTRPSGANSFSRESGEAVLVGKVRSEKVRGALRFMLGYNNTDGTPRLIQRTNPVYHPRYTNLICTNVAEEELKPGGPAQSAAQPPLKSAANTALDYIGSPLFSAPPITFRSGYKWARLTARFQPVPWTFAGDEAIDRRLAEDLRNTWIEVEPRTEFLSLDGFQLIYAEGESCPAPLTNPKGKPFPAPFGQLLVKPDVAMHWQDVPRRFVMLGDLPTNILNCLGKVNASTFRNFPAGTLLFLGAKMLRTPWALAAGSEDLFNYQITLMFSYFNPTKGKTGATPAQITTNLGHNSMPWRGLITPAEVTSGGYAGAIRIVAGAAIPNDTNAGKWFLATRTGGSGVASVDPRLIEEADFQTIFQQAA